MKYGLTKCAKQIIVVLHFRKYFYSFGNCMGFIDHLVHGPLLRSARGYLKSLAA